jgi:branched-chain amino acid transport system substrate-binding protein
MKIRRIQWKVLLLTTVLMLWGPVSAKAAEVKFLDLTDYTGPVAGLALPGSWGYEDYFKDLNAKGGVEGVKIKYIGVDTRYDVARGLSAFKRYRRDKDIVAVGTVSTPFVKMLQRLTRKDKMVIIVTGDGEFQAHIGNFFIWGPAYQDAFAATLDWIKKDWTDKGKSGSPKVGFMSWDSAYGREPFRGGKEYAEKIGVELLRPEFFPVGNLKFDVYLTRLNKAGADYVYVGGVDPTQTSVMRDATALGLTKKIQFVSDYWGPTTLGVSLHPEALEGMVVVSFFLRGEESLYHPLLKRLWSTYRKKAPEEMNEGYGIGVAAGISFGQALKDAIKRVGKNKITREEIYKSYLNISGLGKEGITGPCAYSPTSRRGSDVVKFYKVTGGKIIPITDWIKTPDAVALHKWK